eukprot:3728176-Rhodomonas_salina.2
MMLCDVGRYAICSTENQTSCPPTCYGVRDVQYSDTTCYGVRDVQYSDTTCYGATRCPVLRYYLLWRYAMSGTEKRDAATRQCVSANGRIAAQRARAGYAPRSPVLAWRMAKRVWYAISGTETAYLLRVLVTETVYLVHNVRYWDSVFATQCPVLRQRIWSAMPGTETVYLLRNVRY